MDKEVLYRFFEGTATANEEQQIREWLENSEHNREVLICILIKYY